MPDTAGPKIVIAGTREDWPGGAQTLTPRDPTREPNGRILWFGAALDADGSQQVWFRITAEAVGRMREKTPRARGARLIHPTGVGDRGRRDLGRRDPDDKTADEGRPRSAAPEEVSPGCPRRRRRTAPTAWSTSLIRFQVRAVLAGVLVAGRQGRITGLLLTDARFRTWFSRGRTARPPRPERQSRRFEVERRPGVPSR